MKSICYYCNMRWMQALFRAGKQWVRLAGPAALLMLMPGFWTAQGQGLVVTDPGKVEAAYLRNFAHYVEWPSGAFAGPRSPWCIGILGPNPFGDVLEKTLRGRTEQGRPFEIRRSDNPEEMKECQIVFIAYRNPARRRAALAEFRDKPVLTVSDTEDFLRDGGIIRFEVGDRVSMSINLDRARSASLKIPTKMLEVSDYVVENNEVRRLR
jgi:hypothetical protein